MDAVEIHKTPGESWVVDLTLPSENVSHQQGNKHKDRHRRGPGGSRRSNQEILDVVVTPSTESDTNVQSWPLPCLRGQIVLFLWIWNQGVVGSHHSNVQLDEILEEGSLWKLEIFRRVWQLRVVVILDVPPCAFIPSKW
ncbi:hypothetical protein OGAPHI_001001 [Ogataea philodendri]|uniref:Uncharacterized protein n=1 Tax=Ogataea philodendri TaxID=1378263 RepID=A0A9P8T945_9ASCO|nr:uncharacterized protein OGAPHI_001001 [Ogataea philodendri]KAH3670486.1 hypothetical protein OGAPHI_001001 [Ogataea philodendri]